MFYYIIMEDRMEKTGEEMLGGRRRRSMSLRKKSKKSKTLSKNPKRSKKSNRSKKRQRVGRLSDLQ